MDIEILVVLLVEEVNLVGVLLFYLFCFDAQLLVVLVRELFIPGVAVELSYFGPALLMSYSKAPLSQLPSFPLMLPKTSML